MSLIVSFSAAAAALLLLIFRARRLASRPPRPMPSDPRPRALAEAAASAIPVLIAGSLLVAHMGSQEGRIRVVFTMLAMAVCLMQFRTAMRASRL